MHFAKILMHPRYLNLARFHLICNRPPYPSRGSSWPVLIHLFIFLLFIWIVSTDGEPNHLHGIYSRQTPLSNLCQLPISPVVQRGKKYLIREALLVDKSCPPPLIFEFWAFWADRRDFLCDWYAPGRCFFLPLCTTRLMGSWQRLERGVCREYIPWRWFGSPSVLTIQIKRRNMNRCINTGHEA